MGLFNSIASGFRNLTGGVDPQLLSTGILARGEVREVTLSGTTVTIMNGPVQRKCTFRMQVLMDGAQPFEASFAQRVPEIVIPQLQQQGVVLAVRVDAADHSRIAIDFANQPPQVRLPEVTGHGSAADILATGKPITVVLVADQLFGVQNSKGDPVHALTLTVATGVETPYQIQVGNAVPASALPLVYPGSKLHAKLGDAPGDVVVDWAAGPVS